MYAFQGTDKLEGEMQAVRALLGNSSNIVAALRDIATSGAGRYLKQLCHKLQVA